MNVFNFLCVNASQSVKKILLNLFAVCLSYMAYAQFEGTVLWNTKLEFTDPEMFVDVINPQTGKGYGEAEKLELQQQMSDPEFKKMMESNPEAMRMMEQQMKKSGGIAGMLENMVPKNMEMKFKNYNSLVKVNANAFKTEVLYLKEKDQSYSIDRDAKTYSVIQNTSPGISNYKVTKTEEFATILGFKARKFVAEGVEQGQKVTIEIWATTDIKDIDQKQILKFKFNQTTNGTFIENIEGFPLKIQMSFNIGKMLMEAVSLKREGLASSVFEIPVGFKEKNSKGGK
jgi:hypothetical protein